MCIRKYIDIIISIITYKGNLCYLFSQVQLGVLEILHSERKHQVSENLTLSYVLILSVLASLKSFLLTLA